MIEAGRQTFDNDALLVVNWRLPFELAFPLGGKSADKAVDLHIDAGGESLEAQFCFFADSVDRRRVALEIELGVAPDEIHGLKQLLMFFLQILR